MRDFLNKLIYLILQPWQRLPLGFHYASGRAISGLMRLAGYRKDVVVTNLSRSFPELKYKQIKALTKDFYRHLGEIAAETLWIGGRHYEKGVRKVIRQGIITIKGNEELYQAHLKGNVMILNSHCGNWELMGPYLQITAEMKGAEFSPHDVAVVYRALHGKFSEFFFARNRTSLQPKDFDGYVESRVVMRYIISHRKERKIYVFPNDQYPYGTAIARKEVNFLNQSTATMTGAGEVAAKFAMSVFYMNADRTGKGRYTVRYTKICDDASALGADNIINRYYELLEKDIRNNPANYLWSHKRWK